MKRCFTPYHTRVSCYDMHALHALQSSSTFCRHSLSSFWMKAFCVDSRSMSPNWLCVFFALVSCMYFWRYLKKIKLWSVQLLLSLNLWCFHLLGSGRGGWGVGVAKWMCLLKILANPSPQEYTLHLSLPCLSVQITHTNCKNMNSVQQTHEHHH